MKLGVALAATGLTLAAGAGAAIWIPYPDSSHPVWLTGGLVRFESNLATHDRSTDAYVVKPDGSGLRRATVDEAAAGPAASPKGERLAYLDPTAPRGTLLLIGLRGRTVIATDADPGAGTALSPDGRTAVFGQWVGWAYADGYALYAVPTDRSSEPTRLTPTPCSTGTPLGPLRGRCLDGTDGGDRLIGTKAGDLVIAGSGDDVVRAGDGDNVVEAQWGDDAIRTGSGPDRVWGGDGADDIRTGAGSDRIVAGTGRDAAWSGRGADYVWANDGARDVVDCGPGDDRVVADRIDVVQHCEHVVIRPPNAGPQNP